MSNFTDKEIAYLKEQRLGRLATVGKDGSPHVVPIVYTFNDQLDTIDIYGYNMSSSKKFRDIQNNAHVAFVVDDVLPPWETRGIEVRGIGTAHQAEKSGADGRDGSFIRIEARHIISWGLDTQAYKRSSRKVASTEA